MNTKQRIISQAISLFNRHGVANVSVADLSKALNISKGNLTYHFANKSLILEAVFDHLVADINVHVDEFKQNDSGSLVADYYQLLMQTRAFVQQYSFFYTDILEIIRHYPSIAKRYRHLMAQRQAQGLAMINKWTALGILQPEPLPGHYQRIQHSIWMTLTFWQSQITILPYQEPDHAMAKQVMHMLWPYLTEQGKVLFNNLGVKYDG